MLIKHNYSQPKHKDPKAEVKMEHSVMEKMQQDIHKLTQLVEKLYAIIAGHELDKESGIVHQVKDHENRIKRVEDKLNKAFWIAVGVTLPAGLGVVEIVRSIISALK